VGKRGAEARAAWTAKFEEYKKQFPQQARTTEQDAERQLPDGWDKDLPSFAADPKGMATRESSGKTLNVLARSADPAISHGIFFASTFRVFS